MKKENQFPNSNNFRQDIVYYFSNLQICKKMYLFLHNVGYKRFGNLIKHYDQHGISLRRHGNENRTPNRSNVLNALDVDTVVQFLKQYAKDCGKPISRRLANFKDYPVTKLPPTVTKMTVYRLVEITYKYQ